MKQKENVSGNVPVRILILTAVIAVIVYMTSYLKFYISDVYTTAGLIAVICLYITVILFVVKGNESIYKLGITLFLTIIFILAFVIAANASGLSVHFQSHETMVEWIESLNGTAELIYIAFHIVQVVFLPIPGVISIVAGTMLFGPFKAATLSMIGVMIGSTIMFFAGRIFGKRLAEWIAGKESVNKYLGMIKDKDKIMLTAMFVLPFFPDDLLCMVAGLTSMSFRYFFIMAFLTRIVALYTTAYLGSGEIIPYKGWGLAAWAGLIIIVSVLLVILWRNGDKIQNYINEKISKKK